MSDSKQVVIKIIRLLHLLQYADHMRYAGNFFRNRKDNRRFLRENPGFRVPPSAVAYDAYGDTNWRDYYRTGRQHARYISDIVKRHVDGHGPAICEWGCGPARVLRHLPHFLADRGVTLHGFDYNGRSIDWCRDNIDNITFQCNSLAPPLPCGSGVFDFLYCLSVFTHLSAAMHFQWMEELARVVKPDGLILFTTHGDAFRDGLVRSEQQQYDAGKLVVRDKIEEGKRCFVTYHPPAFIRKELLRGFEVVFHSTEPMSPSFRQDVWLVRNRRTMG